MAFDELEKRVANLKYPCTSATTGQHQHQQLTQLDDPNDILNAWHSLYVGHRATMKLVATKLLQRTTGFRMRDSTVHKAKPIVIFLLGPSGSGKTFFASTLAQTLSHILIDIGLNSYTEANSVARLIGTPPGYVGYNGPTVLSPLIHNPRAVILLDEIEKAHKDVHKLFFDVFDAGQFTLANNTQVICGNAIFIITSNLGCDYIKNDQLCEHRIERCGFHPQVVNAMKDTFDGDAFLNRVEMFSALAHFSLKDMIEIGNHYLESVYHELCESKGYIVGWVPTLVHDILSHVSFNNEDGVRMLQRMFDTAGGVRDCIWKKRKDLQSSDRIVLYWDAVNENVTFDVRKKVHQQPSMSTTSTNYSADTTPILDDNLIQQQHNNTDIVIGAQIHEECRYDADDNMHHCGGDISSDKRQYEVIRPPPQTKNNDNTQTELQPVNADAATELITTVPLLDADTGIESASSSWSIPEWVVAASIAVITWAVLSLITSAAAFAVLPSFVAYFVVVVLTTALALLCYYLQPIIQYLYHLLVIIAQIIVEILSMIPDASRPYVVWMLLLLFAVYKIKRWWLQRHAGMNVAMRKGPSGAIIRHRRQALKKKQDRRRRQLSTLRVVDH
jgi:hypothetical protein